MRVSDFLILAIKIHTKKKKKKKSGNDIGLNTISRNPGLPRNF